MRSPRARMWIVVCRGGVSAPKMNVESRRQSASVDYSHRLQGREFKIVVSGEQGDQENGGGRGTSAFRATNRLRRQRGGGADDGGPLRGDSAGKLEIDGSDEEGLDAVVGGGGAGVTAFDSTGECHVQPLAKDFVRRPFLFIPKTCAESRRLCPWGTGCVRDPENRASAVTMCGFRQTPKEETVSNPAGDAMCSASEQRATSEQRA